MPLNLLQSIAREKSKRKEKKQANFRCQPHTHVTDYLRGHFARVHLKRSDTSWPLPNTPPALHGGYHRARRAIDDVHTS